MVVLIVWLWDRDRKGRIKAQEQSDERYEQIVKRLQAIIEGNTTAMITLADKLSGKISNCPMASDPVMAAWMRTWMEHSSDEMQKRREGAARVKD